MFFAEAGKGGGDFGQADSEGMVGREDVATEQEHESLHDFKQQYNECFVNAFAEDLDSLREAGANSKLILHCIEATSKAFVPSEWHSSLAA